MVERTRRRRPPTAAPLPTHERIGVAALRLLDRDGVLAGVSMQDVADEAGVSRPLVNHYFGHRRVLLRSALDARRREFAEASAGLHWRRPISRAVWAFRAIIEHKSYARVMALLAIDGDETFEALPWLHAITKADRQWMEDGVLPADGDPEVGHAVFIALACGWSVFREAFARDLGLPVDELDERAEKIMRQMFEAFIIDDGGIDEDDV
jgi:AcrR family transcriptional regulator